jgi:phospholipase C
VPFDVGCRVGFDGSFRRRRRRLLRAGRNRSLPLVLALFCAAVVGVGLLPSTQAKAATVLFSDGFESGNLSAWTASHGIAVQQQIVHAGTWAARATSTGAGETSAYRTLSSPVSDLYALTWFRVVSASTPVKVLRVRTAAGDGLASAGVNAEGRLEMTDSVTKTSIGSSVAVSANTWHSLELHASVAGASSRIDVWFDGAAVPTLSRQDPLGAAPIGRVEIGDSGAHRTYDIAFDDVAAATSYVDDWPPTTPTGLSAAASTADEIDLSWQPSTDDVGVVGYEVYRSTGEDFALVSSPSGASYVDTGLSPSTTYSYEVLALDAAGNASPLTSAVNATTPASTDMDPPTTPTDLTAGSSTPNSVQLTWTASTDDQGVTGYTVFRFDGAAYQAIGTVPVPGFSDTGLSSGTTYLYEVDAFDAAGNHSPPTDPVSIATPSSAASPITHVVVIDLENHSFDSILGRLCAQIAAGTITGHDRCDGATTARLSTGAVIPIATSPDLVPGVDHSVSAQTKAVDGGAMDGFNLVSGCGAPKYGCISQFNPSQLPNAAALAERFVISDRTFEFANTPSWAGHMALASATTDGFKGNNPQPSTFTTKTGPGWGCDSYKDTPWWNGSAFIEVPSCVPNAQGAGPYRASPVPYVPTIFDRLDGAGLSWKIFGGVGGDGSGYGWTICPTFYECLGSSQRQNLVPSADVVTAAQDGTLPNMAIVTPTNADSEHNGYSMAVGDNWLGQVVGAIEGGPDWPSTAIFITWDDCGCFYDHVPPAFANEGIRVPMVIASPYARLGLTDSNDATYASILAYVEHNFGLTPLSTGDATAYDYSNAFDYSQSPATSPVRMVRTKVKAGELRWIAAHPDSADDPT